MHLNKIFLFTLLTLTSFSVSNAKDSNLDNLRNGLVEQRANKWVVKIRVEQDNPENPDSGLALRIANTLAKKKLVEFACGFKPIEPGENVSAKLKGVVVLSSDSNASFVEVVVAADVQKAICKIEKKNIKANESINEEPVSDQVGKKTQPSTDSVVRDVKSDY